MSLLQGKWFLSIGWSGTDPKQNRLELQGICTSKWTTRRWVPKTLCFSLCVFCLVLIARREHYGLFTSLVIGQLHGRPCFFLIALTSELWVCECAQAAITKHNRLLCINSRHLWSQFWSLEVQDQGVYRIGFFWGLFPWLADDSLYLVFPYVFSVCVCVNLFL